MEIIFLLIGLVIGVTAAWLISSFRYKGDVSRVEERSNILEQDKSNLEKNLNAERQKVLELNSKLSSLQSDYTNLQQKLTDQKAEIEKLQEKFTKEFENLANKIFKEKTDEFSKQSKTNLQEILNPLKERIAEFQSKVEETNNQSISRAASLREQLQLLKDLNQQISQDAQNLTNALRGETKTKGIWGEFILESILEKSGLEKGREYFVQEVITDEEGKRFQPDVIVKLPENRSIIIDSKVTLSSYERYISEEDEGKRQFALKEFLDSVRKHIKDLEAKSYQKLEKLNTLDFVLMFIPIESAFITTIRSDVSLFNESFEKHIVLVSPSTLFATLTTIASIWRLEKQNKYADDIANESGKLYDKFVAFIENLVDIGKKMDQTKTSYVEAMKKLSEGTGNLVSRAEKIKQLGAKTSKSLPPAILNRAIEDSEE